ncbi:MAG: DUF799 family lipoprotein [Halieaceae bacterium]|nr:DUF799 family lipoprotein [Halieaceae bacterium]
MKNILCAFLVFVLVGCETLETKREAYPKMYDPELKPVSLVVVPAVNKTTAADAGDLITATIPQPFADNGYYILPLPIVHKIFQEEGVVDGVQMISAPASMFRDVFGADAVLYVTIEEWETNYIVLAANVTVGLSYVLRSTTTDEVLWSYKARQVVDTAGQSSGFLLLDVIKTAVTTAMTDYLPIAYRVNAQAVTTMPYGDYHPQTGADGDSGIVLKSVKDAAATDLVE